MRQASAENYIQSHSLTFIEIIPTHGFARLNFELVIIIGSFVQNILHQFFVKFSFSYSLLATDKLNREKNTVGKNRKTMHLISHTRCLITH